MYTRKTDILGRIVIPKDLRIKYDILDENTPIDIIPTEDGIMLKKHVSTCMICGGTDSLVSLEGKNVCKNCVAKLDELVK